MHQHILFSNHKSPKLIYFDTITINDYHYKMSSGTQGKGATPTGNQPTTATRGGASAYPTPANNSGGGAGWGDSGIIKGGLEGIVCWPIYFPSPSPTLRRSHELH
jgi:hypothetical protein